MIKNRNFRKQNLKIKNFKKNITSAGLLAMGVIFSVTNLGCGSREQLKKYDETDALAHSHVYIQSKLKSPASAQFEIGTDGVKKINDTIFTVTSYVDSQNKFGALLRNKYSLKVIFHPKEDTHDIVEAKFE